MSRLDAIEWRYFRTSHHMTQRDLARVLGITRRTVQYIESGNVRPHYSTEQKFLRLAERHENEARRRAEGQLKP